MTWFASASEVDPWWREAHEAARRLASTLDAAASRAGRDGVYEPPPGVAPPRRRRRPGSLRHIAEVIRTHRLAPGLAVDKDIVAKVFDGDLRYLTDPIAVIAVARASCLIAGAAFSVDDAHRLTVACDYVATLVQAARDADRRAPDLVPAIRANQELARSHGSARFDDRGVTALSVLDPPVTPRRPGRQMIAVGLVVALAIAAAAGALAVSRRGSPSPIARVDPTTAISPIAVNPNCYQDAPPAGSDLLDVPHLHPAGDTKMDLWWPNDGHLIEMTSYRLQEFDAAVYAGRPNIWDLVIVRSCLPLVAGRPYRLTLTARADIPATVRVRVQEPEGVVMSFSTDLRLGPQPRRLDVPVIGGATSRQGELMFQVGGVAADYRLRVTDIALVG